MSHSTLWLGMGITATLACEEPTGPSAAERAWTVEDGAPHSLWHLADETTVGCGDSVLHSAEGKWLKAGLQHLSGYEVSY
jgi:hypothetical protein